jgi:CIC family chloride channel protein
MTGNLSLLAPAMIAVALSTALVGDESIYRSQLPDRAHAPAHRMRFSFPLLSSLLVRDAMRRLVSAGPPDESMPVLKPEGALDDALEQLAEAGVASLMVVEDGQAIGTLSARDVVTTYRAAMGQSIRRTRTLPSTTGLLEMTVPITSPIAGQSLGNARLPAQTLIVSVMRDGEALFPTAQTKIESGDVIGILTPVANEPAVRNWLTPRI